MSAGMSFDMVYGGQIEQTNGNDVIDDMPQMAVANELTYPEFQLQDCPTDAITQCMYYDPYSNTYYSSGAMEQITNEAILNNSVNAIGNQVTEPEVAPGDDSSYQVAQNPMTGFQSYALAAPYTPEHVQGWGQSVPNFPSTSNYDGNSLSYVPQNCFQYDNQCFVTSGQETSFHYPAISVSHSGLITVLLRNDISVEMTLDRTIRLVSHQRRMALAVSGRGNSCCVYHPAGKIRQENTTVDGDLFLERKVRMTTESITFSNGDACYIFDYDKIRKLDITSAGFPDISSDYSVNLLFASDDCSDEVIEQCTNVAQSAVYECINNGYYSVKVNGVRITQYNRGDVSVVCGPKFLRLSPSTGALNVQTHFADIAVEANWSMKVRRGSHTMSASHMGFVVANGKIEAGFDDQKEPKAMRLPQRVVIDVEPSPTSQSTETDDRSSASTNSSERSTGITNTSDACESTTES